MSEKTILFLGLCAKKNASGGLHAPLAPTSRSGNFLSSLLQDLALKGTVVARDNIIPEPVTGADGAERNPTWHELLPWLREHRLWTDESVVAVVAFGGEAKRAFLALGQEKRSPPRLYFFDHPAYALRQPRGRRAAYAQNLIAAVAASDAAASKRKVRPAAAREGA